LQKLISVLSLAILNTSYIKQKEVSMALHL